MNIILIGFMGTGKTTVGKRLAKQMGWVFVDVDRRIEASAKRTIPQIFAERGEAVFRRLEQRQITSVVRNHDQVIAAGGGAFVNLKNRSILQAAGPVVCLIASPKEILKRVSQRIATRPMLAGVANPLARIQQLLAQRISAYSQANITVDTSDLTIDEVVESVLDKLSPHLCQSWQYFLTHAGQLSSRHGGQYVVVSANKIVGFGHTQLDAYRKASRRLPVKRDVGIYYIPLPEESLTAF